MMHSSEDILSFWFGDLKDDNLFDKNRQALWFGGGEKTDNLIQEKFEDDLKSAIRGEWDAWQDSPRGRLALIILLDQFSRNIYRDTPKEVAQDKKALSLSLEGIAQKIDLELKPIERVFFYLPIEHAESLEMQKLSVRYFENLVKSLPEKVAPLYKGFLDYAKAHFKVIERFDRFPYQNDVMGRKSTPEEIKFLNLPGAPFFL
jgi:uncharacterized protein (DUF924 family)